MARERSLAHFLTNWRESELPARRKGLLLARNLWLRVLHRAGCCGHEGEPGC